MPSTATKTTMSAITSSPLRRPLSTIPVNTAAATARGHVRPPLPASVVPPFNHYRPVASFVPSQKVKDVVTNVSKHVWRTPVLRERQSLALSTLLENKACDGTLLFVDRTGGGKSHVMRVAGTCVRGIIVVTAPTLALAADVFEKFKVADESTGFVDAIHFDEDIGTDESKRLDLISDLRNIKRHTKRTVFLFISPQKLAKYSDLRSCLLACNAKKTMRMILIDEFHMHCQHGMDFR
jgi:superfamily II DNA helicase RecQ